MDRPASKTTKKSSQMNPTMEKGQAPRNTWHRDLGVQMLDDGQEILGIWRDPPGSKTLADRDHRRS
ncbi:hypothetical protein DPMN_024569 [Dreissena polymorpha]|uniref:Uncharacterized protein n=1 Tax=Dreissena polymorpha TaxID=45954 RepID=A0A9D4LMP3_DREPO|nr:hypothetical protein DPMN_024569 [Dreissena polymorpha]